MHSSTAEESARVALEPNQETTQPSTSSPQPSPKRRLGRFLTIVIAVLAFAALILAVFRDKVPPATTVAPAAAGDAHPGGTLRLKGTTEAVRMSGILAPVLSGQFVATLTVVKLTPNGTRVKQGDLLAEFDRQAQIRDSIDKQAEYDKLANQVVGEQAKEDAARAKDETELKQAEDSLSKAQLEKEKAEIMSRIDAEKAQENLEEAQATLAQLRETFALKRRAARAAIRILAIQRDRTRQIMMHARADADLMQIRSPLDGVVVLNTIWKQGKMGEVQEGDQLRPGNPFMQVVDPSVMQVRVPANQQDFLSLRAGQPARVHLDAYPDLVFPGTLEEMAPVARSGDFSSRLRNFAVVFSITGQDPRLMPDLSAAVDVDLTHDSAAKGAR